MSYPAALLIGWLLLGVVAVSLGGIATIGLRYLSREWQVRRATARRLREVSGG